MLVTLKEKFLACFALPFSFNDFSSISLQQVGSCMVDVIKASSPAPKLFHFFAALQYQLHFFMKKADLCPHIPYDELKNIALESGMKCCPVERN